MNRPCRRGDVAPDCEPERQARNEDLPLTSPSRFVRLIAFGGLAPPALELWAWMPSVTPANAALLSRCDVRASVLPAGAIKTEQFYPRMEVRKVEGGCLSFPLAQLPTGYAFIQGSDPIVADPGLYPSQRDYPLAYMGAMVDLAGDIATNLSEANSVMLDQVLLVARGMQEAILDKFYDPTAPAPADPLGLPQMVDAGVYPWWAPRDSAGHLQLADLGCMTEGLSPLDPSAADYFVMTRALLFEVYDLYRAQGMAPPKKEDPLRPGVMLPTVYDVPVLISDHIPPEQGEAGATYRIYLARLRNGADAPNKSEPLVRLAPAEIVHGARGDPADFQVTENRSDSGVDDMRQLNVWKSVAYSAGSNSVVGMKNVLPRGP